MSSCQYCDKLLKVYKIAVKDNPKDTPRILEGLLGCKCKEETKDENYCEHLQGIYDLLKSDIDQTPIRRLAEIPA